MKYYTLWGSYFLLGLLAINPREERGFWDNKALYVAHERRRPSKRWMSVNQLNFISEYEE